MIESDKVDVGEDDDSIGKQYHYSLESFIQVACKSPILQRRECESAPPNQELLYAAAATLNNMAVVGGQRKSSVAMCTQKDDIIICSRYNLVTLLVTHWTLCAFVGECDDDIVNY